MKFTGTLYITPGIRLVHAFVKTQPLMLVRMSTRIGGTPI